MQDIKHPQDREKIAAAIENLTDLPTLPQVARKVLELSQDPKTSYRDLKTVILPDPPLAAKVMMMANSAFFHRRDQAKTLEEAIFTIGLNNLVAICSSVGVLDIFSEWGEGEMDRRQLWRHSVATAFLAKSLELRKVLNKPDGPDTFLAGLLHDIGWIVLDKIMPEKMPNLIRAKEETGKWSLEMERNYIGMDHTEAGALFLKHWKIPPAVIEIVENHHAPENAKNYPAQTGVVRVASILVRHRFKFSLPFDRVPEYFPHHLQDPTGLKVVEEMEDRYQDYIKQADTIADLMTDWL
jgi:putative nucleotidyltransferase with HDIG domain